MCIHQIERLATLLNVFEYAMHHWGDVQGNKNFVVEKLGITWTGTIFCPRQGNKEFLASSLLEVMKITKPSRFAK